MLEILYLEDNLGDYFLIEEYLYEKFEKISISQCSTYTQAADKIASGKTFHLILLDLHLSDSKGIELISSILNIAGSIPVIILTGFTDEILSKKSLELGVSSFLIKDDLTAEILEEVILQSVDKP